MDFDQLLLDAFGTSDLSDLPQDRLLAGVERLRTQFGAETAADQRFAIWCLLYMLGGAPDPDDAFEDAADREAARDFVTSIDQDEEE